LLRGSWLCGDGDDAHDAGAANSGTVNDSFFDGKTPCRW
jgi:hypothetical protein